MDFAGIKVPDTALVRDAMDLSRSLLEPFLFNHVMRSWLFGILLSEAAEVAPDAELLAIAATLHDLGLTKRYTAENRFEVDGANAAREFLNERGIPAQRTQLVWDAIALHTTPTLVLHKCCPTCHERRHCESWDTSSATLAHRQYSQTRFRNPHSP